MGLGGGASIYMCVCVCTCVCVLHVYMSHMSHLKGNQLCRASSRQHLLASTATSCKHGAVWCNMAIGSNDTVSIITLRMTRAKVPPSIRILESDIVMGYDEISQISLSTERKCPICLSYIPSYILVDCS